MTNPMESSVDDHYTTISNEETLLQYFLLILKTYFLSNTYVTLCLSCSNHLSHTDVLPVAKDLTYQS